MTNFVKISHNGDIHYLKKDWIESVSLHERKVTIGMISGQLYFQIFDSDSEAMEKISEATE